MIEKNGFQILNPDTLTVLQDYSGDKTVQITYLHKKMCRSTVLNSPILP